MMISLLNHITSRAAARVVALFLFGLLLTAAGTMALRGVSADALGKFGLSEQSRAGKLIKSFVPQALKAKRAPAPLAGKTVPAAPFATQTVTNGTDTGSGSLRSAIAAAGTGDTIVFSGVTTVTLTSAELVIDKNLTINGGTNGVTITRSGTTPFRIFKINSGVTVSLSKLTISNGNVNGSTSLPLNQAGGVQNYGTLTMTDCAITGNTAPQTGGIQNDYVLTMNNCLISGNTTAGTSFGNGGGITAFDAAVSTTLNNCTISGNTAIGDGGGFFTTNNGAVSLTNCTVTNNTAGGNGGGMFLTGTVCALKNTIVINNTATGFNSNSEIKGTVDSTSSFNLIGVDGTGGLSNGTNGNQVGVTDALLGGLANNGGYTQTVALLPNSPALNAGDNTGAPATDQRGIARPQQGTVDIGAYESRGFTLAIASGNNQSANTNAAFATPLSVTVTAASGEPVAGGVITFTPPGSGASCTIAGNVATISGTTATSGTVTANGTGGSYTVAASAEGVTTGVNFSLTNVVPITVSSINRVSSPPACINTTVSWTVTFSASVTGVTAANFTLFGGTNPSITNVSGSGTTWTVTANTGTAAASLALRMANSTGVSPTVTGLPVTGQAYTVSDLPTTANAGPDQTLCNVSMATLAANAPSVGTGAWSVVSGPSTSTSQFSNTSSPTATFTPGGGVGTYTLRWTISSGSCTASTDDVVLTYKPLPTTANAGPDQTLCTTSPATLAANTPTTGTGTWSVVTGPSTLATQFSSTSSPTATFTPAGGAGNYTLRWTISNAPCTASTNDVVLTYNAPPVTANAGPDQTLCTTTSALLAANSPGSSTGAWSVVSGPSLLTSQFSSTSLSTATFTPAGGAGVYTLRWTISKAPCTASTDDVVLTYNAQPTTANAGPDQTICATATLAANTPSVGTGAWSVLSGPSTSTAQFSSLSSPTATFTPAGGAGAYTLRWAISSNSPCTVSTDQVVITTNAAPVLTYGNASVAQGSGTTVSPATGPTDDGTINSIVVQSVSPSTAPATITVDNVTGVVTVPNNVPVGTYTVTVRATDGCGATKDAPFTLAVNAPTPTLGNYAATTLALSAQATVTPDAAPTNTTTIQVKASSGFNGTFYANPTTGVVKIVNANPAGTHTVTVTAFGAGGTTTKTFTLTVQSGTACATPIFSSAANLTIGSAHGLAVGDFNNDGKQDLAIANNSSATVSIRLGDGAGGFTGTTTVSTGTNPNAIAVGDFNGDGNQDLAVVCSGSNVVSIRLGDGAGNFSGTTNISTGSNPKSVAVGDFNGDGKLDFVTVNFTANTVSVRFGDGAGGFTGTTNVSVGTGPGQVVVGDFDGDGDLDFATSNQTAGTVSVRLNDGAGNFSGTTEITVGANPEYMTLGDFNKDGKLDFVTANQNAASLSVGFGNGAGNFTGTTTLTVAVSPRQVLAADFNNDGNPDIAVKHGTTETVNYLLGNGLGGFAAPVSIATTGLSGSHLALGDFNGDGRQDFATSGFSTGLVAVRLNGCNVAPSIVAGGPLTRQAGATGSSATIATVSDTETAAGSLTVAATTVPTGITVTGITNTSGTITATVTAGCNASVGDNTVVLTVTDGNGATNTANLTVNVTAAAAPSISTQPANQTVCAGSTATFSVTASNAVSYQWQKNGANISGATASSYTTPATVAGDNGALYSVVITGTCNSVTSNSATLTVNAAPAISAQPTNQTVCVGATASFSVTATGAGLTYQWRKNGTNISGATSSNYTTPATTAADDGALYSVVVSGTCGTPVTSGNATLTVNAAAAISTQPANQTVCVGATATFSVGATGAGLTYQWQKNGTNISGATASSFTTPATTAADNGATYSVVITGACGLPLASNNATLTVNAATAINTQPQAQTVCAGATASFSVTATGAGLTYQWRKNGTNISGATASTYTTPATTAADNGATYSVVIGSTCGTPVTSSNATLTVNAATAINTQPANQTVCVGATASFSVTAAGTGLTYQWQKNGTNISGATASSYTTPATTAADNGATYSVVVSGACGTAVTSGNATLTVNASTAISAQPQAQTVCVGATASFSVTAAGTGLTYQWRKNGTNISGATASTYTTPATVAADNGATYSVIVSGTCGTPVTSGTTTLTVNAATAINTQPQAQTVCVGATASFSVTAAGTGLTYQWRKNGTNISGATASTYTTPATVAADNGATYSVIVSGTCGTPVTSGTATLTVNAATAINTQPQAQTVCVGATASFSVTAAGTGLTYQWQKNGTAISGATASTYTTPATTAADNGAMYSVVVSGACGTAVTSGNAALTVNATTAINTQPQAQTVCVGATASFSVTAAGTGLTYQWQKNGTAISGATASSFTTPATTIADNGALYSVVVSGTCGTQVTSGTTTLTVNAATAINTQPQAQTVCVGATASFSVTAAGTGLTYQWQKNGTNISGATASTYTTPATTAADNGAMYSVVVSGACGTAVTSGNAALTVNAATAINTQPQAQTVCAGAAASFSVTAAGTGLSYQWRKGGVNISGATASTYSIAATTAADAANYDVVIAGTCGTVTSNVAALTVNPATTITTQPVSLSKTTGQSASFSVVASGSGTLTYQWRKNGTNISGATLATFSIASVIPGDAGSYSCVVTGSCGAVTSNTAVLNVGCPAITTGPPTLPDGVVGTAYNQQITVTPAGTYNFTVSSGALPNGVLLNAASGALTGTPNAAGVFNFSITATDANNCSDAQSYTVTICAPPAISVQPQAQSVCIGAPTSFSVTAAGSGLTYQWRKGGANISGATASTLTIAAAAAGDAGNYDVVITGACGTVTSNVVQLTVNQATAITAQPTAQTVCAGAAATFSVTATGSNLSYQWRKNGTNISGATASSFSIAAATAADAANYDVVVNSACGGSVTSNPVALTVNNTLAITTQPTDQTVCAGAAATFSVTATGAGLTYQWRKNGTNISGATASSFNLAAATAADAATYSVVVTSTCGTPVTSANAVLTINPATAITAQPVAQTVCAGAAATFSVTATGSNLSYQWRKNGTNISGATASSFSIAAATAADAANYDVVVSGACGGSVTSNPVVLTVNAATVITAQPMDQTVCAGAPVAFSVTATGSNLSYQWRKNGANINGATASSFNIAAATAADAAAYSVVVTGACGTPVTSNIAQLTVNPATVITQQPLPQATCLNGAVTFSVTASGANLAYQWRKGGVNIPNATASSLTLNNVAATDAGSYDVVVAGTCGTATSNAVTLSLNNGTTINAQPQAQTVCAGTAASFTVVASGSGTLTYQWRKNNVNIPNATGSTFSIASATAAEAGSYDVVVGSDCGTVSSNAAQLTVNPATAITAPPAPQTKTAGQSVTFNVAATGGNLTYQWRKNSANISGATNATFTINAVTLADAGSYDVVVSGTCGTQTSAAATLAVNCQSITVTNPTVTSATLNAPFNQAFTQTGGVGTTTFSTASALPAGLTLSSGGVLSGTPTQSGTFNLVVKATDSNGCQGTSASYALTIGCAAVTLNPASLPDASVGTAYNQTLSGSGGSAPYTFAVQNGSVLPAWLTLTGNTLSGTPAAAGSSTFSLVATDANGCTGTRTYTLTVPGGCSALTLNPSALPAGTLGTAYNQTLSVTGGSGPYTFSVTSGALPTGLTLDANAGTLTGTPLTSGTFIVTLRVTNQSGCAGQRTYILTVNCVALTINPASLPAATAGVTYSQQFTANGTGTYSLQIGSLPPGLSLRSDGLLAGVTTQTGTYNFTVKLAAGSCTGTRAYTLTVNAGTFAARAALAQLADYDGDGKADAVLWHAMQGQWSVLRSSDQQTITQSFGAAGDLTVLGDYDGDGISDLAVFRSSNGMFYVKRSSDGGYTVKAWGAAGDVPVPGDYDGDGTTDFAVFRPSEGNWYVLRSADGQYTVTAWGAGFAPYNDVAVPGDYDGDGQTDVAVFRRATGTWLIRRSSDGQFSVKAFGQGTDTPVAADYDGDGRTDIALWRDGTWYIWQSATESARVENWGTDAAPYNDQATPDDYDGDGKVDVVVWRAGESAWYIHCSVDGSTMTRTQNTAGVPAVAKRL